MSRYAYFKLIWIFCQLDLKLDYWFYQFTNYEAFFNLVLLLFLKRQRNRKLKVARKWKLMTNNKWKIHWPERHCLSFDLFVCILTFWIFDRLIRKEWLSKESFWGLRHHINQVKWNNGNGANGCYIFIGNKEKRHKT